MSVAVTTKVLAPDLRAAARGDLPAWAMVSPERREHISRVADLLCSWAADLRLPETDRIRWSATAWLHDALRDAKPEMLRPLVPVALRDLEPAILHGPAAAARLGDDADRAIANAIRYHTIGHPALDRLGRCLYLADFLEPGRDFRNDWRMQLRERMPDGIDLVLQEVTASRIGHLLEKGRTIRPETVAFWNDQIRIPS